MPSSLPLVRIEGPVHRLIPSKFPVIGLWDSVAGGPEDIAAAFEVEALTNPRAAHELRILQTLPPEQWISGPGATPLMAAICNPSQDGSRFADGSVGAYYAATRLDTAIAETLYHTERFIKTSQNVDPGIFVKRRYACEIHQPLPHIDRNTHPQLLEEDPQTYVAGQAFARVLRQEGAAGLHYPSVRDPGGECVAIFDPRAVRLPVRACEHYQYHWNGERITDVTEIGASYQVHGSWEQSRSFDDRRDRLLGRGPGAP